MISIFNFCEFLFMGNSFEGSFDIKFELCSGTKKTNLVCDGELKKRW